MKDLPTQQKQCQSTTVKDRHIVGLANATDTGILYNTASCIRVVRLCVREVSLTLISFTHDTIIIGMNVCGSAYENWCVVDGMCATAAD